ncbi:MAG TPA: hypothetical protein VKE96_27460 [Vicinamibacterales bacterium]|nr:hypothetical protein [Vicinamibacterales bacterium]
MSRLPDWYRSEAPIAPGEAPRPSASRALRNWLRTRLPDPDVRDKTIVLYARRGLRKKSAWAGMFSEFHHALGALVYGERCAAAGVRIDFRSALYVDPPRGPNWWTYFFTRAELPLRDASPIGEVHLTQRLAKYGRYGGFCDVVNGATPYLYPMTYGVDRADLHRLVQRHVEVRPEIRDEVDRIVSAGFLPGAFVVGVHYRGTDSTHSAFGLVNDYRIAPVPYAMYLEEVRRAIAAAAPARYQVLVATDERDFVDFMRREVGSAQVVCVEDAPRTHAGGAAVHFDRTPGVSNYEKGKSGLIDCLLLARSHYLVKGRSNLSDASLVFNEALPYSLCLR